MHKFYPLGFQNIGVTIESNVMDHMWRFHTYKFIHEKMSWIATFYHFLTLSYWSLLLKLKSSHPLLLENVTHGPLQPKATLFNMHVAYENNEKPSASFMATGSPPTLQHQDYIGSTPNLTQTIKATSTHLHSNFPWSRKHWKRYVSLYSSISNGFDKLELTETCLFKRKIDVNVGVGGLNKFSALCTFQSSKVTRIFPTNHTVMQKES